MKTYYGFEYETVIDAIQTKMPGFFEIIEEMGDELLFKSGAEFEWFDDSPGSTDFGGKWADDDLERRAKIEIIRQLIGLLFQCQPPVLEPPEAPFLLPEQLTKEYAAEWFQSVIDDGGDKTWYISDVISKEYQDKIQTLIKQDEQS